VFEDNRRQRLTFFSADAVPVSAALVIDQSLTSDVEKKVNEALKAISGAFTPYDEIAVFTYANGVTQQTGFTAALGDRLPAVLEQNQAKGRDMGAPISSGPLASGPTINGQPVDPNLQPFRGTTIPVIPKEVHTINDAIFAAAKVLAHTEPERRRVIYVISDGREYGSKISQKQVERFLLTNNIAVYGTVVGESAMWGVGYLDKIHIPLLPQNNVLPKYAVATGGSLDSEVSRDGIERSFAKVTEAARTEYTLGYNSPIPVTSPQYRKIEVRVNRPGLTIVSKDGYYPTPVKQE
jgi:VWFA-related protein